MKFSIAVASVVASVARAVPGSVVRFQDYSLKVGVNVEEFREKRDAALQVLFDGGMIRWVLPHDRRDEMCSFSLTVYSDYLLFSFLRRNV